MARESFDDLDEALAALETGAKAIRAEGPLRGRRMIREFDPSEQVAGRLEISTGGLLRRGSEAGVDVMGDGSLIAFRGGMRRTELDPGDGSPFEAVREALS